jgi:hypothetical protein
VRERLRRIDRRQRVVTSSGRKFFPPIPDHKSHLTKIFGSTEQS